MSNLKTLNWRQQGARDNLNHAQDQRDYWETRCRAALSACKEIGREILAEERRVQE
jgi:hypothetical protein